MHCSQYLEDAVEAFVELGTLIVEGRLPAEGTARGYKEGPHCAVAASHQSAHQFDPNGFLCMRAERLRSYMSLAGHNALPISVEVLLCPACPCGAERAQNPEVANIPSSSDLLLEQWTISVAHNSGETCTMSVKGLFQAVRSQLHFSQLSAWWSNSKGTSPLNVSYRVIMPEEAFASRFSQTPEKHVFPPAQFGQDTQLQVSVRTLPRCETLPKVKCAACTPETNVRKRSLGLEQPLLGESLLDPPTPSSSRNSLFKWHSGSPPSPPRRRTSRQVVSRREKHQSSTLHILPLPGPVDDRMQTNCNQHGKHDCRCEEDLEDVQSQSQKFTVTKTNKINLDLSKKEMEEVLKVLRVQTPDSVNISSQTVKVTGKGDLLLSAILRTSQTRAPNSKNELKIDQNTQYTNYFNVPSSFKAIGLKTTYDSSNSGTKKLLQHIKTAQCDETKENQKVVSCPNLVKFEIPAKQLVKKESSLCLSDPSPPPSQGDSGKVTEEEGFEPVQDVADNLAEQFEKKCNLKQAGVQFTAKEVPTALDKEKFRQSLDSAASMVFHWRTGLPLTSSPAPIRKAFQRFDFDSSLNSVSAIRTALFDGEVREATKDKKSSDIDIPLVRETLPVHYQSPGSSLLGSFEESVLNGRLEPVSTVHGFTADLGASGSFCPAHLVLPVTVFFYTLGDIDKVSSPYLAHINLGKKGYVVPRMGSIQVTLLNPMGTVIKMFVVMYNLTDMPNNSHTFLRQRTLYMPNGMSEPVDNSQKYLRYLIHLRFASSKSGRLTLHTDIRMIVFRKSDMDTATGHSVDLAYELRSFTYGPSNPKFSPRK